MRKAQLPRPALEMEEWPGARESWPSLETGSLLPQSLQEESRPVTPDLRAVKLTVKF